MSTHVIGTVPGMMRTSSLSLRQCANDENAGGGFSANAETIEMNPLNPCNNIRFSGHNIGEYFYEESCDRKK